MSQPGDSDIRRTGNYVRSLVVAGDGWSIEAYITARDGAAAFTAGRELRAFAESVMEMDKGDSA